jgi:hypothetical protein
MFFGIRDPGSGMGKNPDPGSGINIPDPQHCPWGGQEISADVIWEKYEKVKRKGEKVQGNGKEEREKKKRKGEVKG